MSDMSGGFVLGMADANIEDWLVEKFLEVL